MLDGTSMVLEACFSLMYSCICRCRGPVMSDEWNSFNQPNKSVQCYISQRKTKRHVQYMSCSLRVLVFMFFFAWLLLNSLFFFTQDDYSRALLKITTQEHYSTALPPSISQEHYSGALLRSTTRVHYIRALRESSTDQVVPCG